MSGIVANNIFYNPINVPFTFACKNVIFSNNLVYATSTTFDVNSFSSNGNTSISNLFNVDPLFVNPVPFNTLQGYTFIAPTTSPFADFHLQAGSPAIAAGTDGTDLGIYGGTTPWKDGGIGDSRFRYYPLPNAIPIITGAVVLNPVINLGGTLNVQINATTQP